jgi:hypothetical protein
MIKKWKQFESIDEDDLDLARFEFDKAKGFVAFQYRDFLIKGKDMDHLLNYYIETRDKNGEWGGGPVNKEFDKYFLKKYGHLGGKNFTGTNPYRPAIGLTVNTDYGIFNIAFSIKDNKPFSVVMSPFRLNSGRNIFEIGDIINIHSVSNITYLNRETGKNMSYIWHSFYEKNILLDDMINDLNLDIVNY